VLWLVLLWVASGIWASSAAGGEAGPLPLAARGSLSEAISRPMLTVTKRRDGDVIRFFVENLGAGDVTATFELGLLNLSGSTSFPFTATFPPHQTTEAFSLWPIHGDQEWHYTLTNHYTPGSNRAVHDDSWVYALPYPSGRAFRVSQGYGGGFSHQGAERYAIDWKMPKGTLVLAARPGVVVEVKDDSAKGGPDRKFEASANYILIQHGDGTLGEYAHLLKGGVRVKVGQTVQAGTVIGLSGNTGFSSGPHLHFSVFRTKNGKERESIPTRFRTEDETATTLSQGRAYRAPQTLLAVDRRPSDPASD
jgi:hypothetical protein